MSTRAQIIKLQGNTAKAINVYYEGYPEYTGELLKRRYHTPNRVNALIKLGNIHLLEEQLEDIQRLEVFEPSQTLRFVGSLNELTATTTADYLYIYKVEEQQWYVWDNDTLTIL